MIHHKEYAWWYLERMDNAAL